LGDEAGDRYSDFGIYKVFEEQSLMTKQQLTASQGFTLIELMIVTAIVAILASIAYPSYVEYIERTRRNDAKAVLLEAAQFMERKFTETGTYVGATLPLALQKAPREGSKFYDVVIVDSKAATYALSAVPASWIPKKCGTLSINQLGTKSVSDATPVGECWGK
jgi:type IV pilus assembly protein PilE